jgi:hypothetical protein
LNKKIKIIIPVFIAIVLVSGYLILLIQEEPSPTALEFFSVDKVVSNATGAWEGLGNLTIRYNGNETLDDILSIQVHYASTGQEVMSPQTVLFVLPEWNYTIPNVNTNLEYVVTLTYKGEVVKLTK